MTVRYGVNGSYVYKNFTNGVDCTNENLENDPAYGLGKVCSILINTPVIEAPVETTPIVTPTPMPTTVPSPAPTSAPTNGGGSFDEPQISIAPLNQDIEISPKVLIQLPSFSFGKNNVKPAFKFQLKKEGRTVYHLQMADDEVSPYDSGSDNHPTRMNLVMPLGKYEMMYKHESQKYPDPIAFTFFNQYDENTRYTSYDDAGGSRNYDVPRNYRAYSENGLQDMINSTQLRTGDLAHFETYLNDNHQTQSMNGSIPTKYLHFNFIKDGKISPEDVMIDWSGGNYDGFDKFYNFIPGDHASTYIFTVRSNTYEYGNEGKRKVIDRKLCVTLQIHPRGNGETGTFKIVSEKGGLDIAEEHLSLSKQTFGQKRDDGSTDYGARPFAIVQYKITNNSGCIVGNNILPMTTSYTIKKDLLQYDCK